MSGVRVSSLTVCLLALLSMTAIQRVLGLPADKITKEPSLHVDITKEPSLHVDIAKEPSLHVDITSSVSIGRPLFGEALGPITAGQVLRLTCTLDGYHPNTISWWENGSELAAEEAAGREVSSSVLSLGHLSASDTGRRLTCRENETRATRSVVLEVVEPLTIVINENDKEAIDGNSVEVSNGGDITLTCILQGHNPSPVSWWEGETELTALAESTHYPSNSRLTLRGVTAADTGRVLTCRSQGGELPRTLELIVNDDKKNDEEQDFVPDRPSYTTRTLKIIFCFIILLLVCVLTVPGILICYQKICKPNADSENSGKIEILHNGSHATDPRKGYCGISISETSDDSEDEGSRN